MRALSLPAAAAVAVATVLPTTTAVAAATPIASSTSVGAHGTTCPANAPSIAPHKVGPFGLAFGARPVWASGFHQVGSTTVMTVPPGSVRAAHGFEIKVPWFIAPHFEQHVVLTGRVLRTGASLWFQIGGSTPTRRPVLDPRDPAAGDTGNPDSPNPMDRYAVFPGYSLFPVNGCYSVTVAWPAGHWHGSFEVQGLTG